MKLTRRRLVVSAGATAAAALLPSPRATAASEGPPPVDRVLIGLLQGELKLATQEVAVLKLIGDQDPQLLHKLTEAFAKVNRPV